MNIINQDLAGRKLSDILNTLNAGFTNAKKATQIKELYDKIFYLRYEKEATSSDKSSTESESDYDDDDEDW